MPIEAALALIALSAVSFMFGCAIEYCVNDLLKDRLETKIERVQSDIDEEEEES